MAPLSARGSSVTCQSLTGAKSGRCCLLSSLCHYLSAAVPALLLHLSVRCPLNPGAFNVFQRFLTPPSSATISALSTLQLTPQPLSAHSSSHSCNHSCNHEPCSLFQSIIAIAAIAPCQLAALVCLFACLPLPVGGLRLPVDRSSFYSRDRFDDSTDTDQLVPVGPRLSEDFTCLRGVSTPTRETTTSSP